MENSFLQNTSLIEYSSDYFNRKKIQKIEDLSFSSEENQVRWYNTYGIVSKEDFKKVVIQNDLNDFLLRLYADINHPNKVIDMNEVVFMTIQVLKPSTEELGIEQMVFILTPCVIWSIQERKGDHFGWIRDRLQNKVGLIRDKNADYLMYFILDSILENYSQALVKLAEIKLYTGKLETIKTNPEFMHEIEQRKNALFLIKRATTSLRDGISKLETTHLRGKKTLYYNELKEQSTHILSDLEFELHKLESAINLLFTIQGSRLNEVMKILTLFSVIFIPLTFLAGVYGMNFENMPELKYKYGYFITLGTMAVISLGALIYFYRKKWL